ncbi:MAG: hypothetical protein JWM58_3672 [Rhizobium sp.]|nr:hypothetical protein [Rhizobium sp.]
MPEQHQLPTVLRAVPLQAGRHLWLHRPAMHALLICDVLFTSRVYLVPGIPILQPLLLGTSAALILFYAAFAYMRGHIFPVLLLMSCIALIINQLYVFEALSSVPLQFNSAFQFVWVMTFIVFFVISKDGNRHYLVNTLFMYASLYVVFYVAVALLNEFHILPAQLLRPLILEDHERGQRLFNYSAASAFAWFGWLYRAKTGPSMKTIVMLAICGLAIFLTLSRVFMLILILLTFAYLFRLGMSMIKVLCLSALWTASVFNLYGFVDSDWNPFALFSGDSSGSFRMLEYNVARIFLLQNPLSGIGIAPSSTDSWHLLGYDFFAAGDLGITGVWFDLGLFGLVLFFIGSHIACKPVRDIDASFRWPLVLTGCLMAGYGCIAPVIFYPAGATYFAILLGLWLDRRKVKSAQPLDTPLMRLRQYDGTSVLHG